MKNNIEKMTFFGVLKEEFRKHKLSVVIQLLHGICSAIRPFIFICFPPLIIDYLITQSFSKTYLIIGIFALSATIIDILAGFIYAKFQSNVYFLPHQFNKQNILKSKQNISKSIVIDFKYMEQKESLEKYTYSLDSAWTCCSIVYDFFTTLIIAIVKFILIISLLLTLDLYIVLFVVGIVIINYFINALIIKKNKQFGEQRNKISRFVNYYDDILAGLEFGKEKRLYPKLHNLFFQKYTDSTHDLIEYDKKVRNYNFQMTTLTQIISTLQNIGIYFMMIHKYSLNEITLGSFFAYVGIANELYSTFSQLINVSIQLSKFKIYAKTYNDFMKLDNVYENGNLNIDFNKIPNITFENVTFKYPNTDKIVLDNINFKIEPHEKFYISGENGSGKTTLMKLLLRLYEPCSGEIKLNGININQYDYKQYLLLLSIIFQDFNLYKISIKDNICFHHFDEKRFEEIISKCELNEVIEKLPNKENSNIDKEYNEDGIGLSGGEEQKIAIARSLYKDAKIFIFDEPTAALDPISEKKILSLYNKISKNNTSVIISHRMSTASLCNHILVLKNGKIIEEGSFHELMDIKGEFYENYRLQSKYYE